MNQANYTICKKRVRQGRDYLYNPITNRFLNQETGKWVMNPTCNKTKTTSNHRYYRHPDLMAPIEKMFSNRIEQECVGYLFKLIALKQTYRRMQFREDDAKNLMPSIWIDNMVLGILFSDGLYTRKLDRLVSSGILNREIHPCVQGNIPTYGFSDPQWLTGYELPSIQYQNTENKVRRITRWKMQEFTATDRLTITQVIENFSKIDLTATQFLTMWHDHYYSKYLLKGYEYPLSLDEYMDYGYESWNIVECWNQASLEERWLFFKVDGFGKRLHHPFTRLPSEARKHILDIRGNPLRLVEFDVANSQPAIFASLLVQKHGIPISDRFIRSVETQKVYEDLAERKGTIRDIAKPLFLQFLYCKANGKAHKEFTKLYGHIADIAAQYKTREFDMDGKRFKKGENHKLLSQMMQRKESSIFRVLWFWLRSKSIAFLPIHDAIYITERSDKKLRRIRRILQGIIGKRLSIKVLVNIKHLS